MTLDAARGVIVRTTPRLLDYFMLEVIPAAGGKDVFEIESIGDRVVLRGNTGGSIAAAYYHYLKYFLKCHVSWCGDNLELPNTPPALDGLIRKEIPYTYRYNYNYCTYSYSMAFWDWERWEKEIDWMALHGINMPLAITGEEAVWREVYRDMGLSDEDLDAFFVGPAYFGWGWMGNLDAWGGPLPQRWIDDQCALQKKILDRERALGMKPVLPAFTGHVPPALLQKFPDAKIQQMRGWSGFDGTYVLDPMDPLFIEIGKAFLIKQTEMFGTDHLYSADTFNEMDPPSTDLHYLADISRTIYRSMAEGDPLAVNVMQGWLFLHGNFWQQDRIEAYLGAVPDDRMILLDLFATAKPQWERTNAFGGKPWIWCMLHNWGGKMGMYGRTQAVGQELPSLLTNPDAGRLVGIGLTMEGIGTNPFMYELMTEMAWRTEPVDLEAWTREYVRRRYGKVSPAAEAAWMILIDTLYDCTNKRHGPQGAHYCMRPTPEFSDGSFVRSELFYDPAEIRKALQLMLDASKQLGDVDPFQYDLVDLARQCMSDLSLEMHREMGAAYENGDAGRFEAIGKKWLQSMLDLDRLLRTRPEFLLGNWLEPAKARATSREEKALYEWNARSQITLWGPRNSPLHDYAQKQWSGLMRDFYYPRWEMMIETVAADLRAERRFDRKAFDERVSRFEESWTKQTNSYPTAPSGAALTEVRNIFREYLDH
ncbi:MAG: alpha-N-acetylglucosaminidase [Pontiellaceae bacterium]|nr:alpha-N-acetylglucosaminidase [Pontiellaceae bacterium]MBN2786249.1 alpha-N-acetylglucosaminidase [Pontiellaceae bacterium]